MLQSVSPKRSKNVLTLWPRKPPDQELLRPRAILEHLDDLKISISPSSGWLTFTQAESRRFS